MKSLTATSWPFFLVQMYFPLLAFSATLWPSHSTENMLFADLQVTGLKMRVCWHRSSLENINVSVQDFKTSVGNNPLHYFSCTSHN